MLVPRFPNAGALFEAIERFAVSYLFLTPMHLQNLLPVLPRDRPRLPGLRRLEVAAMAVQEALRREIRQRLTPNLAVMYGTNEVAAWISAADGESLDRFPDSIGFPAPGVEMGIADDEGQPLPPARLGLIRARVPGMPAGYLDDPEASAKTFRDGWYYPGDLGMLAPEGALYFKGRADDMMNFNGIKIYPAEIEAALLEHAAVAEAAAFALPSPVHQDVPAAFIQRLEPVPARQLDQWCRNRLLGRAPQALLVMRRLPRDAAGRVDKPALARAAAKRTRGR